jgi:hypothetical protein
MVCMRATHAPHETHGTIGKNGREVYRPLCSSGQASWGYVPGGAAPVTCKRCIAVLDKASKPRSKS